MSVESHVLGTTEDSKRQFHAEMESFTALISSFFRVSHLEDAVQGYIVHCSDDRIPRTAPTHTGAQTLPQQGAQRAKEAAQGHPELFHGCSRSPSLRPQLPALSSTSRHCWRPRDISHDSPMYTMHIARPSLQSRLSPPDSLLSTAVPYLCWV